MYNDEYQRPTPNDCDSDRYFLAWVKAATDEDLLLYLNTHYVRWKRVAIERELSRRV